MKRATILFALSCSAFLSLGAQSTTPTDLGAAERAARAGGDATRVTLGDILVLRGHLTEADSVYLDVIARRLPDARIAAAGLAENAARRGDRVSATRFAAVAIGGADRASAQRPVLTVAAGRAYAVLGRWDPQAFHDALRAFDAAAAADSNNVEAQLRAADLLLEKYNAPDARVSYEAVLRRIPTEPRALLGLARAAAFDGTGDATALVRKSLAVDPVLVPALLLLAEQHLQAEAWDSARITANRALAIDSTAIGAWGVLGAIAWMQGDSAGYHAAESAAARVQPRPADFYAEVGEAAARQRRYADGVIMGHRAVAADSTSARAYAVLADNQLRTGAMTEGRASLDRAFVIDPYNLWHKNLLDLLDQVRSFTVTNTRRFQFVAPASESAYLTLYLEPLLEAEYDTLSVKYGYQPPVPIRVELYGRHADFSVRTIGLTGLGALGVSFGTVLILDSPQAQAPGELNYGSTTWHELGHTFTLGLSGHRIPRWLSEGLSVLEERQAGRSWGFNVSPEFLATFKGHALPSATNLNEGLVRPAFGSEITFSYYEASLVAEMIEAEHGMAAIRAILKGYADGFDTPAIFQRVLSLTPAAFDAHFDRWVRDRFAMPLAAIDSSDGKHPATGHYFTLVAQGQAMVKRGAVDSAGIALREAERIFPTDGTDGSPADLLAGLAVATGDRKAALEQITVVTRHDETTVQGNQLQADLQLALLDSAGALASLDRQQWITPYDIPLHLRIAALAESLRLWPSAVRARRSIVDLAPPDPLEARYQLARVLAAAGDRDAARHEVLTVLEQAPAFEKAQALLLELQGTHP